MWTSQTLELGRDRSLHLVQAGTGPDLLLIHGALGTHHDWLTSPVAEPLARDFRVTIVDRPGHGLSRRPRFSGTPRDQAAQIVEGMDRLGIERAVIGSHSYGGVVSLAMAERFPERVAALALAAPLAFPEARLLEHSMLAPRSLPVLGPIIAQIAQGMRLDQSAIHMVHELMFFPGEPPARWKETYPYDQILTPGASVMEGEDAASMLPLAPAGSIDVGRIQIPARVVTGTSDKIVEDERQAKLLGRLMPKGEVTEVPRAGHMLHHTHADIVERVIREAAAAAAMARA
jgi:pimeloyl-ACP methyl ester carboxylesterase